MKQISANFGAIKDTIYAFSAREMIAENKNQANILNEFYKLIKENSLLKLQYMVFKNIENGKCSKERLAERYINENLKLIENQSWDEILTVNRKLRLTTLDQAHVEAAPGREQLYEAIHTLIKSVTSKGFTDINASQEGFDYIMEHLMKNQAVQEEAVDKVKSDDSEMPKFASWKFVTELAVSKFNERYAHLDENERNLVKILLSPYDIKHNYYLDLKNENLNHIEKVLTENIDEPTKDALNVFKSKITTLKENIHPTEIDDVLLNLEELKQNISDLES